MSPDVLEENPGAWESPAMPVEEERRDARSVRFQKPGP